MDKKSKKAPKAKNTDPGAVVREAATDLLNQLLDRHYGEIESFREDAEDNKIKVGFGLTIDYSGAGPEVTMAISYKKGVKDSMTASLTDPNQGTFEVVEEATGRKGKTEEAAINE